MKLLTSPALKRRRSFLESGKWWFCLDQFVQFFDLPKEAENIRLEFHDRPGANRYRAEAVACYCGQEGCSTTVLDGENTYLTPQTTAFICKRLGRTEAYVECTYEI